MSTETDVAVIRAALDNCPCAQGVHTDTTAFAALDDLHSNVKKLHAVVTALDAYLDVQFGTDEERQGAWESVLEAYDAVGG